MANHIAMLARRQHVSCAIAGKEYRFDADHFFWCGKGSDRLDASDRGQQPAHFAGLWPISGAA
ncbi:hypothetical protein, partial [Caldilinea sp.]|uniref:hypothetical protein n=1 Tax=Caldilinea sp. TaxID=2293560 RepID=UPI002C28A840|nr:hypothetical protein [Caldilinea sp.]